MFGEHYAYLMAKHAAETNRCLLYKAMFIEQAISRDPARFQPHCHCVGGS